MKTGNKEVIIMGKNKKKKRGMFDLSAEEQMASADFLYDLEQGEASIADLFDVEKKYTNNGIPADLEAQISADFNNMNGRGEQLEPVEDNIPVTSSGLVPTIREEDVPKVVKKEKEQKSFYDLATKQKKNKYKEEKVEAVEDSPEMGIDEPYDHDDEEEVIDVREIKCDYNETINHFFIDDDIVNTPCYAKLADELYIEGVFDQEDVDEKIEVIFTYIVSLKHPSVIYTTEEFDDTFSGVNEYDEMKFMFMERDETTIYAYYVDYESFLEMKEIINEKAAGDLNKVLAHWINIAYACGIKNNGFITDDIEYVLPLSLSEYNSLDKKKSLANLLFDDDETDAIDSDEVFEVISVEDLQKMARKIILTLNPDMADEIEDIDDFDDEDDGDEEDTSSFRKIEYNHQALNQEEIKESEDAADTFDKLDKINEEEEAKIAAESEPEEVSDDEEIDLSDVESTEEASANEEEDESMVIETIKKKK